MRKLGKKIICLAGIFGMIFFLITLLGMEYSHSDGGKMFISLLGRVSIFIFPAIFLVGIILYIIGGEK